jgi:hypothetical protein
MAYIQKRELPIEGNKYGNTEDDGKDCGKTKGAVSMNKATNQEITFSSDTSRRQPTQVYLAFILG